MSKFKGLFKRVKNPLFVLAFFSFLYQALVQFGIHVDFGLYQQAVDIFTFVFLGFGIYSTYDAFKKDNKED